MFDEFPPKTEACIFAVYGLDMGDGKADGVSMGEAGDHARMTHLMV
jgi:hypothetical protein